MMTLRRYLCLCFILFILGALGNSCTTPSTGGSDGTNDSSSQDPTNQGPPGDIDVSDISGPPAGTATNINPAAPTFASGKVTLPNHTNLSLTDLRTQTVQYEWPVEGDGSFTAGMVSSSHSLVPLLDDNDNVVLLSMLIGVSDEQISAKSTATALLYFALGGYTLTPDDTYGFISDLEDSTAAAQLADVIEQEMARDPLVITHGSDKLTQGIEDAVAYIESGEEFTDPFALKSRELQAQTAGASDALLTLDPSGAQSGILLLPAASGPEFDVRNSLKRDTVMYLLETGYDDLDAAHIDHPVAERVDGPIEVLGGQTLVTSAGLTSLFDTTSSSPWTPHVVGPFTLPGREDATRTYYDIVVVGPSFDAEDSPLLDDVTYYDFADEWRETLAEQRVDSFALKFMMPIAEQLSLGTPSGLAIWAQPEATRTLRQLVEPVLEGAGVSLRSEQGYIDAIGVILDRTRNNRAFREDLIAVLVAAYGEEIGRSLDQRDVALQLYRLSDVDSMNQAISFSLGQHDAGRVLRDLGLADDIVVWHAEVGAVEIGPEPARVSRNFPDVDLTATVSGDPATPLSYEWSVAGENGQISSALDASSQSFTTAESAISFHAAIDAPEGEVVDRVTVRVRDGNGALVGADTVVITGQKEYENPCDTAEDVADAFDPSLYDFGDRLSMKASSNAIAGGLDLNVLVTLDFSGGSVASVPIEVFLSGACSACSYECSCTSDDLSRISVDGDPNAGGRNGYGWVLFDSGDNPPVQGFCMASASSTFALPEGSESGSVTHEFTFPIPDDQPGCPAGEPNCACPSLGGVFMDGDFDDRLQVWRGMYIVITAGNTQRIVRPIGRVVNAAYNTFSSIDCGE